MFQYVQGEGKYQESWIEQVALIWVPFTPCSQLFLLLHFLTPLHNSGHKFLSSDKCLTTLFYPHRQEKVKIYPLERVKIFEGIVCPIRCLFRAPSRAPGT